MRRACAPVVIGTPAGIADRVRFVVHIQVFAFAALVPRLFVGAPIPCAHAVDAVVCPALHFRAAVFTINPVRETHLH